MAMALNDLLAKLEREAGTPGTAGAMDAVPAKPWSIRGCTAGTSGTAEMDWRGDVAASAWLLHFADRGPLEVQVAPKATRAEMLTIYPDAVGLSPFAVSPERRTQVAACSEAVSICREVIDEVSKVRTNSQMISGKSGAQQWAD
jgi:hypothetical protein